MFFGMCFSEFNPDVVITHVMGDTIDDLIDNFVAEGVDFDTCLENGQITIIEGNVIELRKTWVVNRDD